MNDKATFDWSGIIFFVIFLFSIQPLALISSERYEREVSPGMRFKYFLYNHNQLIFENNKERKKYMDQNTYS